MASATTADKNFQVWQDFDRSNLEFYDALEAPLQVHGLIPPKEEGDFFRRIPEELAKQVNEGVIILNILISITVSFNPLTTYGEGYETITPMCQE